MFCHCSVLLEGKVQYTCVESKCNETVAAHLHVLLKAYVIRPDAIGRNELIIGFLNALGPLTNFTHWPLLTPYGDTQLGQHCFRQRIVARHQAIH